MCIFNTFRLLLLLLYEKLNDYVNIQLKSSTSSKVHFRSAILAIPNWNIVFVIEQAYDWGDLGICKAL